VQLLAWQEELNPRQKDLEQDCKDLAAQLEEIQQKTSTTNAKSLDHQN
jgi:hypothetical protein